MRRGATGVTRVLAALLVLGGASAGRAQQLTIQDVRLVEGSAGLWNIDVDVMLSAAPSLPVTVNWSTLQGSAAAGIDFISPGGGTLTFNPPFDTTKTITSIQVNGDTIDEWLPQRQDEVFFVELSNPSATATIKKGRATVTLVDDDHSQPGLQFVSAVSDSTGPGANEGRNRLQWRVPAGPTAPQDILIRWNSSSIGTSCTAPASDTAPAENQKVLTPSPDPVTRLQSWTHDSVAGPGQVLVPRVYCYSLFTRYPALTAERVEVVTRTFNTTAGPEAWVYAAGYQGGFPPVSVVPPTVGLDAVYTVSTDGVVHAMQRGPAGGTWPLVWNPLGLGKPAHNRSPVVPLPGGWRLLVGTESGEVHSVDASTGSLVWSRSAVFGSSQLMTNSTGAQATPAALLKNYGGLNDLILVGTATPVGNTRFFALGPATGGTIDYYPNGPVGPSDLPPGPIDNVYGMAVVDYAGNRVYFGTAGATFTLWSLDLGPLGSPNLTLTPAATLPWNPKALGAVGGTVGSPVLRNGRLYLGTDTGAAAAVHSLRLSDGVLHSAPTLDGEVKGFLWPDRRNDNLYFSTQSQVNGVSDDGLNFLPLAWSPLTLNSPSIVLQKPGSDYLYVGDKDGQLVQIDVTNGNTRTRVLEPGKQIGAPSLDNSYDLVLVGSETGAIYAVRVPF